MEGAPWSDWNDRVVTSVMQQAGSKVFLIPPERRNYLRTLGDMDGLTALKGREPEWLPMVTCVGRFQHHQPVRDTRCDLSIWWLCGSKMSSRCRSTRMSWNNCGAWIGRNPQKMLFGSALSRVIDILDEAIAKTSTNQVAYLSGELERSSHATLGDLWRVVFPAGYDRADPSGTTDPASRARGGGAGAARAVRAGGVFGQRLSDDRAGARPTERDRRTDRTHGLRQASDSVHRSMLK